MVQCYPGIDLWVRLQPQVLKPVAEQLQLKFHWYNRLLPTFKPTTSAGDGKGRQEVPGSTLRARIYNGSLRYPLELPHYLLVPIPHQRRSSGANPSSPHL